MDEIILSSLTYLVAHYPWLAVALTAIGFLRVTIKPMRDLAKAIASKTVTKSDDEFLEKVERSKVMKAITYVLDLTASVKVPAKTPAVTAQETK